MKYFLHEQLPLPRLPCTFPVTFVGFESAGILEKESECCANSSMSVSLLLANQRRTLALMECCIPSIKNLFSSYSEYTLPHL